MIANVIWILGFVAVIWAVELVNGLTGHELNMWGILPRTTTGLIGIPLSPFLHSSFNHVLSNTIPFLVLGSLVAFQGRQTLLGVSLVIIVLGGGGVWLAGRAAFHALPEQ